MTVCMHVLTSCILYGNFGSKAQCTEESKACFKEKILVGQRLAWMDSPMNKNADEQDYPALDCWHAAWARLMAKIRSNFTLANVDRDSKVTTTGHSTPLKKTSKDVANSRLSNLMSSKL
jgi:hypothetical protein